MAGLNLAFLFWLLGRLGNELGRVAAPKGKGVERRGGIEEVGTCRTTLAGNIGVLRDRRETSVCILSERVRELSWESLRHIGG